MAVQTMSAPLTASEAEPAAYTGNAETLRHISAEFFAAGDIAAVGAGGFQLSNTGDGFQLCAGLPTGADDGGDACVRARKEFRGHAGGRAGAQLAHVVGFNLRQQIAGGNFIEQHKKANFSRDIRVLLFGDVAAGVVRRGHVMKKAVRQFEAAARLNHHFTTALLSQAIFHGLQCHGHGEYRADFVFIDVQGHGFFFRAFSCLWF